MASQVGSPPVQELGMPRASSPFSVETAFRELDDVFLQTQTKVWLGEVLGKRLDEKLRVSELLSDGELLFEVSRALRDTLVKCMELQHSEAHKHDPFASRKGSGRYTPYCNVDSFLKICKLLGLNGIDLFSPSDVVDRRNTRKVCLCIRLLSKRARSKDLNVPDFDIVTSTVPMPTEMVGCIRKSLERSQCSALDYHRHTLHLSTKRCIATAIKNHGCHSEDSDNSGSNFMNSDHSFASSYNNPSRHINPDLIDSPEVSSARICHDSNHAASLDIQDQEEDAHTHDQRELLCSKVSAESLHLQQVEHDYQEDGIPRSCVNSQMHPLDRISNVEDVQESCVCSSDHVQDSSNASLASEGIYDCSILERCSPAQVAISRAIVNHETWTGLNVLFHEDGSPDVHGSSGSRGSSNIFNMYDNGYRSQYFDEHLEVSSISSAGSVSSPLCTEALDAPNSGDTGYGDNFLLGNGRTEDADPQTSINAPRNGVCNQCGYLLCDQAYASFDFPQWELKLCCICNSISNSHKRISEASSQVLQTFPTEAIEDHFRTKERKALDELHSYAASEGNDYFSQSCSFDELDISPMDSDASSRAMTPAGTGSKVFPEHNSTVGTIDGKNWHAMVCLPSIGVSDPKEKTHNSNVQHPRAIIESSHEMGICQEDLGFGVSDIDRLLSLDDRKPEEPESLMAEYYSRKEKAPMSTSTKAKLRRRPLLKSVVSGTAVLGAMFIFHQLRRNGRETSEPKILNQKAKANGRGVSRPKGGKDVGGWGGGRYPGEKLKLWG